MALDFQKIPIVFGSGLDTKTDRKMVLPTKLLELNNGVFKNAQTINKRYGYDHLSQQIDGADDITSGAALSTYKNELLLFDGTRVYSRLDATDTWADRGSVVSVTQETTPIISNGYEQINPDMAVNAGIAVYAWEDSRDSDTVRYSVVDTATGSFIVSDGLVSTTGARPKVIALGNYLYILFSDGGSIKYCPINKTTPSTLSLEVVVTTNLDTVDPVYDACENGGRIYISFNNNDSGTSVVHFDTSNALSDEVVTSGSAECIANWADQEQNVWTAVHDGYAVRAYSLNYNLATVLTSTLIEAVSGIDTITGISASDNVQTLFYDGDGYFSVDKSIRTTTITTSGLVGAPSVFVRSVGIASKPFMNGDDLYLNVAYDSELQSTYFTLDADAQVVAKLSPNVAGGHRSNRLLPQVAEHSTGIHSFAACQKGRILSELNTIFSLLGVISIQLDFVNPNNFLTAELGDNLYVIGGIVQSYDGVSFVEHNFHLYPDTSYITITANAIPSGDTTAPSVTITGAS